MSNRALIRARKVLVVISTLALGTHAKPVRAGGLDFQAQAEYDFTQYKRKGSSATGLGRFSTDYTLTLRRPFLPTSSLMSDLSFKGIDSGDSTNSQIVRGWTLNLYSTQAKYMLNGRVNRSTYDNSSDLSPSSTGSTTDYNVDLFLRQPAYPAVSLQYRRQVSDTNYAGQSGSYTSTNWMMSSYYDLMPFRFSFDRSQQLYSYSSSSSIRTGSQSSAVSMDRALLSGLTLYAQLSKSSTDVTYAANDSSNDTNRRVLRLTATPMRSLVGEVSYDSQANRQRAGALRGTNDNNDISWSVRSEILPGLSLDLGDERQTQSGQQYLGYPGSVARNRTAAITARLSDAAVFNISSVRSVYDVASTVYHATQDSLQSSLQAYLSRTTDFTLNYGRNNSSAGAGDELDNTVQGVAIRDRTSSDLSVGATFRRFKVVSAVPGGDPIRQYGDATDVDMSWQPRYDVGIDLRMSYQNNTGSGAFRSFAPSANLRWQIASATNVTANYSIQRYRQFDPANAGLLGQDTKGLSLRMTHRFARGANLDVSYDSQASNITDIEWHRQLRLGFTFSPTSH